MVVGLTFAGVQAGKVGGTLAGRVTCREHGHRTAILILLGSGAVLSLLLSVSTSVVGRPALRSRADRRSPFVTTGAWPLIVDSVLARTEPSHRPGTTVTWNVCEYGVIAAMTATSGWLLASFHRPGAPVHARCCVSRRGRRGGRDRACAGPVYAPDFAGVEVPLEQVT